MYNMQDKKCLEEVFTFRIIVTKVVSLDDNDKIERTDAEEMLVHAQDVYFTGYTETKYFTGTIAAGVDHQKYRGDECIQMRAEYKFIGVDEDGEYCEMDVINEKCGDTWKPKITSDSPKLTWLNDADLSAIVEFGPIGPTIKIYKENIK